jgi:tetratricopeptide (TPR) repeat protein
MRCHLKNEDLASAAGAARKLLEAQNATKDMLNEAHFVLGHYELAQGNMTEAAADFRQVSKLTGTEMGADATYQLAWIAFQAEKPTETEDLVYSLSENFAAFDYWVAKGFILLSDLFVKNGNIFQARQTLQSVIENYTGPELGDIARQKLAALQD